ncbi:hypothetical protein BV898_11810 [Hypsibius exemplaris]|uniref:Uncharacterized protein n=1 Tax=Hypsibius exemplaris TaxID=2072580 RepID=A0A1W0WFF4_HYPEX|nr:hypothetical protein BV898_11810 [Hypsibius exemplaris]
MELWNYAGIPEFVRATCIHCRKIISVHNQYITSKLFKFLIENGIWDVTHRHRAACVKNRLAGFPDINLSQICPYQPEPGSLYCSLHGFLAGADGKSFTPEQLAFLNRDLKADNLPGLPGATDLASFFGAMVEPSTQLLSFQETLPYKCTKNIGTRPPKPKKVKPNPEAAGPTKCPKSRGILLNDYADISILRCQYTYRNRRLKSSLAS